MTQLERESSAPSWPLGGWLIDGELGRGGMGRVFRARHPRTRTRAAIKVLLGDYSHRPDIVARFRQEAIAVNLINHPGIVRVFDSGESADGSPYIVMEYLEGRGLRESVEAMSPEDRPRQVVRLGQQIASAMAAAHAAKVVHRDLKPENILVIDDDLAPGGSRVKILDFGIAKVLWGGLPEVMELDGQSCPEHAGMHVVLTEPASKPLIETAAPTVSGTAADQALRHLPAVIAGSPPSVTAYIAAPLERSSLEVAMDDVQRLSQSGRVSHPTMPFTQEGVRGLGTRSYMAPEQERHSGSVDAKADVYSLGIILYELLEGRTPIAAEEAWPPPIHIAVSQELVALIHRVLSRDPDERPDMASVAASLHRIARAKRELDEALSRWVRGNQAPKLLPRGKELHEIAAWARDVDDLSALERGFVEAAKGAEARRERLTRMLLGLGVVVLMGLVATTTLFWLDAARARRKSEIAERASWDHSRLERAARAEAQRALQRMTEAQKATEEALAAAEKASGDARSADGAREEMTRAKQLAEQATLRARGAAQTASLAKEEAEAKHQQTRSELQRQIAALQGHRERLGSELEQRARELERVKTELRATTHELRTAELGLSNESARARFLQQKLDEVTGRLDELATRYAECIMRRPVGPSAPPGSPDPDATPPEADAPPPLLPSFPGEDPW
jgi:serine/threonine protein kinase